MATRESPQTVEAEPEGSEPRTIAGDSKKAVQNPLVAKVCGRTSETLKKANFIH
jgi:hypothetical protein